MAGTSASAGKSDLVVVGYDGQFQYHVTGEKLNVAVIHLPFCDRNRKYGGKKQGFELLAWEWSLGHWYVAPPLLAHITLLPRYQSLYRAFSAQWGNGALTSVQGSAAELSKGYQSFELRNGSSGIITFHDVLLCLRFEGAPTVGTLGGMCVRMWFRPFWATPIEYAKWDAQYAMRDRIDEADGVVPLVPWRDHP